MTHFTSIKNTLQIYVAVRIAESAAAATHISACCRDLAFALSSFVPYTRIGCLWGFWTRSGEIIRITGCNSAISSTLLLFLFVFFQFICFQAAKDIKDRYSISIIRVLLSVNPSSCKLMGRYEESYTSIFELTYSNLPTGCNLLAPGWIWKQVFCVNPFLNGAVFSPHLFITYVEFF